MRVEGRVKSLRKDGSCARGDPVRASSWSSSAGAVGRRRGGKLGGEITRVIMWLRRTWNGLGARGLKNASG